ncbi:hypothetical protein EMPS_00636 [Entomortierella parvispora]|uniref:Uncharacterized protein n=1 Tax=Entomortierella parvispora TaxID=205924 RepID=A0A9P3LS61_9FUNG|nr:hypothetical protein EMPS_00636 [Entomortierella parvispora]
MPVLQTATLKDLGVLSGDVTFRVSMRHTDIKVEGPNDPTPKRNKSSKAVPNNPSVTLGTLTSPSLQESAFHIPGMTGRAGSMDPNSRDGHLVGPGNGSNSSNSGNGENDGQRQTPAQDISSAMVEANQEIRQLREQQTQEALTDRVKRLSKSSDGTSDKDRFVRSMPLPFIPEPEEDAMMASSSTKESAGSMPTTSNVTTPTLATTATSSSITTPPQSQNDLVRQIAHRVSQQLKEAQERGEPTLNYHSLIAKEIVRGQRAGVLPISSENTTALPSLPHSPVTAVAGTGEVKMSFLERARSKNLPKWMRLSRKGPSSSSTKQEAPKA